jgi:cholesterol transport system auxiliary component
MTNKGTKSYLYVNLLVSVLLLSSCGGRQAYNKRYFILDAKRPGPGVEAKKQITLDVRRFTVDSAFESRALVYRKGEFEYETDFYNEFLISPADMVTEKTRMWLSQSGLFARVLDKGSRLEPTHTLEGNITAFYGDFREKSSPQAVMEIHVFLIASKASTDSVRFGNSYKASVGLKSGGTEGLVEALDDCLEQILKGLERDLQREL